jgi:hypothetical protein
MSKPTTFITITIGSKAYDYPKGLPLPQKGDRVMFDDNGYVTVSHTQHQIMFDEKMKNVMNLITIQTELD